MEKRRGKELNWKKTNFNKSQLDLNMSHVLESLREQNVIGSGASGKVYNVTLSNEKEVVVKKILKKRNEFEATIETLSFIKHVNILKLLCSISIAESHFNLLVFEYIQNGSRDKLSQNIKASQIFFDIPNIVLLF